MKSHLLHRDADFEMAAPARVHAPDLAADLELASVLAALSKGDSVVGEAVRRVLLRGLADPEAIRYRQGILADCLAHPETIRRMYAIASAAMEAEKHIWMAGLATHPDGVLQGSVELLTAFMGSLRRLRRIAEEDGAGFRSEGMRTLFGMLRHELDEAFVARVERHTEELAFRDGVLSTASLGAGLVGTDYVLRRPGRPGRLTGRLGRDGGLAFEVDPQDAKATEKLLELRDRGVALAASALGRSADHVRAFFETLRFELAFYLGCINLRDRLAELGEPICFPDPAPLGDRCLAFRDLYDLPLCLTVGGRVIGNDLEADGTSLLVITGANGGGKSTFLRSVGLAQLMMQAGMFVAATSFRAAVCGAVFTHYRREEDASMTSGRLDEELARVSRMIDAVVPDDLVLFNESFSSTNEREGSEIGRQLVCALLESGVRVAFVTHLYGLGHGLWREGRPDTRFLRAERLPDGGRSFRLVEGEPLPTSHGEDVYRRVFGEG